MSRALFEFVVLAGGVVFGALFALLLLVCWIAARR